MGTGGTDSGEHIENNGPNSCADGRTSDVVVAGDATDSASGTQRAARNASSSEIELEVPVPNRSQAVRGFGTKRAQTMETIKAIARNATMVLSAIVLATCALDLVYAHQSESLVSAGIYVFGGAFALFAGSAFAVRRAEAIWQKSLRALCMWRWITAGLVLNALLVWSLFDHWWTPPPQLLPREFRCSARLSSNGQRKTVSRDISRAQNHAKLPLIEIMGGDPGSTLSDLHVSFDGSTVHTSHTDRSWIVQPEWVLKSVSADGTAELHHELMCASAGTPSSDCVGRVLVQLSITAWGRSLLRPGADFLSLTLLLE